MKTPSKKKLRLYDYFEKLSTLGVRFISKSNLKDGQYYCFEIAEPELAEVLGLSPRTCWKIISRRIYVPSEEKICLLVDSLSSRAEMAVTEVQSWPGTGKSISVDCVVTKSEAFDLLVKYGANRLFVARGSTFVFRLEDLI